jgi:hypothetical protein
MAEEKTGADLETRAANKSDESIVPQRPVIEMERDDNGLFIEPEDSNPETLIQENHNRLRAANKANYADEFVGNAMTFDPAGRYNCSRCNQYQDPGNKCLWIDIKKVDGEAGSCRNWENICAGDPEMPLNRQTPEQNSFGVAENGVGFGCHRCPFQSASKRGPDSLGRPLWCGIWACRVTPRACCEDNGAKTL